MRIFASAFCLSMLAALAVASPAAAKPTGAQLSAIKANCRSDFMSNCWGTPRGGAEAFQCLKEHMAKLSPGCQEAVKVATPPAAPTPVVAKPESAPAPAPTTAPAATETSPPASEAKVTAPAAAPEAKPAASPSTPPPAPAQSATTESSAKQAKTETPAVAEAPSSVKAPSAAPVAALPASAEAPPIIGFLPPRKKIMVLRNCHQDLETSCADVPFGEGRNLRCLFSNKAALTPDCQGALARLTQ
jgi:outer membrane biosynthesis protein TonB